MVFVVLKVEGEVAKLFYEVKDKLKFATNKDAVEYCIIQAYLKTKK